MNRLALGDGISASPDEPTQRPAAQYAFFFILNRFDQCELVAGFVALGGCDRHGREVAVQGREEVHGHMPRRHAIESSVREL